VKCDDLLPEYKFDYTKARPNRFAYVEQRVNYALEIDSKLAVVENEGEFVDVQ
jgi:hypothetical protein